MQASTKKPVVKAKPAAKSPVRAPAKAAKPAAKQTASKPVAKAAKAVAKKTAKPAAKSQAAAKPASKAAQPSAKPVARQAAAPAPKAKATGAKAPVVPAKSSIKTAKPAAPPAKTAPAKAVAARPVPVAAPVAAPAPMAKTGRGARGTPPTPPAPAPVVASTAAKASYQHTMSSPVLVPPPQVAVKKDPKLANNWKAKTAEQLSDAEVLAMPDTEYMNDKQMAFFRLKLVQLKQEILNSAGETTEHLREDTVIVPDPADRATIEEEHALELRTRDRERKLLKKIEQSIARIDAGDYGYCDETGEPIGVGRLLARPTATLSLEAQQRRELKQKMFGD
nr:RNA polymerase-binding protein DksA [Variovorax terrae]